MDRISSAVEPKLASVEIPRNRLRSTVVKVTVSSVPWLIIGGLLWAGLFVKPQPAGGTVQPPVLERRDHFYGIAAAPNGDIWVAGSDGKIVAVDKQGLTRPLASATHQTLQDGQPRHVAHEYFCRKDGSRFWGTGIIAPLRDQVVIATKFFGNLYRGDPNGGGAEDYLALSKEVIARVASPEIVIKQHLSLVSAGGAHV